MRNKLRNGKCHLKYCMVQIFASTLSWNDGMETGAADLVSTFEGFNQPHEHTSQSKYILEKLCEVMDLFVCSYNHQSYITEKHLECYVIHF